MRPLCVIPARRGSKRIALKNIRRLHGKPMLAYTVQAASESGVFADVFVSTEDPEIAEVASSFGAIVHRRPEVLAGDLVSSTDVCLEVEESLRTAGRAHDAIVCLQPTSPLRNAEDVRNSWVSFVESGANYLVSTTPIDPHYFHWALIESGHGWEMYFKDKYLQERPLLPPVHRPNGAIKIGRVEPLRSTRNFFGAPLGTYPMPDERSLHVGEPLDFELAEFLLARIAKP
jgi:CMP-N,N'-diacetyllegionaminic acid synthase